MHHYSRQDSSDLLTRLLFTASIAMLCFAPLIRGGKISFALLTLEILGVLLLVLALWRPDSKKRIPRMARLIVLLSCAIPLFYLIPLPIELWRNLPGRELYAESLNALNSIGETSYLAFSLVPYRTVSSLLAILPPISIFLATLLLPRHYAVKLIYIFLGIAACEAFLGLIQYGSGADWVFWFGIGHDNNSSALGTYPNYDHFAGLMELSIPVALALTAYNFRNQDHDAETEKKDIFNQTLIFFTLSVLLILAAIFSRSRTGIAILLLALPLSSIVFARHVGGQQATGFGLTIGIIAFGIATSIGLIPVLNRFGTDPAEDLRWEIFTHTWTAIKQFFPLGSGPGTFQPIFMAFQPPELPKFVNHAHNDYLELLLETGLWGIILIGLFFLAYITGWLALRHHHSWGRFHFIQIAAGISLFLMGLHSFVDFNLHLPANSIFFAFLSGIFLHQRSQKQKGLV